MSLYSSRRVSSGQDRHCNQSRNVKTSIPFVLLPLMTYKCNGVKESALFFFSPHFSHIPVKTQVVKILHTAPTDRTVNRFQSFYTKWMTEWKLLAFCNTHNLNNIHKMQLNKIRIFPKISWKPAQGCVISPTSPWCSMRSPPTWTRQEDLQWERRPEADGWTNKLAPFDVKEKQVYAKLPLDVRTSPPLS